MNLKKLNDTIYIADQITTNDIDQLVALGIKTIINNRPDQEEDNQPLSRDIEDYACKLGLSYHYLPITPGDFSETKVADFKTLLMIKKSPIAVFCRTGNRSVTLWALSQKEQCGAEFVINQAKLIGYNVEAALSR